METGESQVGGGPCAGAGAGVMEVFRHGRM